jgi:hypothetical protein
MQAVGREHVGWLRVGSNAVQYCFVGCTQSVYRQHFILEPCIGMQGW